MRKFITLTILMLCVTAHGITASGIKWGTDVTSNMRSNTLKQWTESIESRIGGTATAGTGSTFYVDSNVTTEGDGSSWTDARNTLDEAVGLCTDNNGDVIYVAQGHTETITASSGVDIDVAGVKIIGCGSGDDAPKFTFTTATTADFDIDADDVYIYNLTFVNGIDSQVGFIAISNDDVTIDSCRFEDGSSTSGLGAITISLTHDNSAGSDGDSDRCTIQNCYFNQPGANNDHSIEILKDNESIRIIGNVFHGDYDEGAIAVPAGGDACTDLVIASNFITNEQASGLGIDITNENLVNGTIAHNLVYVDTYANGIDPGNAYCFENYVVTAKNASGKLAPSQDPVDDAAGPFDLTNEVGDNTILAALMTSDGDISGYDERTDSLEALSDAISNVSVESFRGTCTVDANGATQFTCGDLSGYGNDYFNTGWSVICIYDASGAGSAPEGDVRDITDYVSASGVFTVGTAFSAQLTTGDKVLVTRREDLNFNDVTMLGSSASIWYVDDGGSGGDGKSWDTALTTLTAAEALCSAGDVILVGRNHNENLTTGGDTINVAGVLVLGMGGGNSRPLFDMDADSDELTLDAAGITLKNLRFRPGANALTSGIRVEDEALGATIEDCAFVDGEAAGTDEWTDCISVDSLASDLTIKNCTFYSTGAPGTFINLDEATIASPTIEGCTFYGACSEAPVWGAAAVPTNINIRGNTVSNTSAGNMAIEFQGAATGVIADNRLYTDDFATMLDPGSAITFGNLGADAGDQQAITVPLSSDTSDISEDDDGSDLERLEYLQNKVEDILAGIKIAGGSVGDVYYVDDGGSGGAATTWATAETTLDAAIADCTANVGDIIFVAPAHDEDLGDAQVTCDVAGITIWGIGEGAEQPQIVCNHANSSIDVTAAGVTIKNINFHSTTAASTIGIDVDAGDFRMEDCLMTDAGDNEFTICVDLGATAENAVIKNCRFNSATGTTGATSCIAITGGVIDRLVVEGCRIWGDYDNAGIYSDQINTNALIKDNSITNNESNDHAIELSAAMTGDLVNNLLSGDTYGSILDPGSMRCFGNKQCVGTDTGAEDVPLIAGKSYARKMLTGDLNASDDLFSVTGSPIIVTSFVGKATVACGGSTTLKIFCDADDTYDYDCSTSVDVDTVDAGGTLAFTNAIGESVLTVQPVGSSGSMGGTVNWWVEEGMLESTVDAGGSTGDMEWYMVFTPVENGCEVIPQ